MMSQNTGGTIVTLLLGTVHPSPPPKRVKRVKKNGGNQIIFENPSSVPGRWRICGWDSLPGGLGFGLFLEGF